MHHAYDSDLKGGRGGELEIWEFGYDLRDHVFDPLLYYISECGAQPHFCPIVKYTCLWPRVSGTYKNLTPLQV